MHTLRWRLSARRLLPASPGLLLLFVACGGRVGSGAPDGSPPDHACNAGCLCITDPTACAASTGCCPTDTSTGFVCENGGCGTAGSGVEEAGAPTPAPTSPSPSPPAPVTCTSQGGGDLAADGGMGCGGAFSAESCTDGTQYYVQCSCPAATCTCSEQSGQSGSSGGGVPFNGCAQACSGSSFVAQMYQACGFPVPGE